MKKNQTETKEGRGDVWQYRQSEQSDEAGWMNENENEDENENNDREGEIGFDGRHVNMICAAVSSHMSRWMLYTYIIERG